MKETVALELSFVNSNLQLLKEQLAELNSSVELYQMQNNSEVLITIKMIKMIKMIQMIKMTKMTKMIVISFVSPGWCAHDTPRAEGD